MASLICAELKKDSATDLSKCTVFDKEQLADEKQAFADEGGWYEVFSKIVRLEDELSFSKGDKAVSILDELKQLQQLVRFLRDNGFSLQAKDQYGDSPIYKAEYLSASSALKVRAYLKLEAREPATPVTRFPFCAAKVQSVLGWIRDNIDPSR
ncbi:MAG: hypothetical protein Q7V63_01290 [Gammaproteobacteria bacterium]|nr:hypothetical protein [Gammaproteobacteria bacterium]